MMTTTRTTTKKVEVDHWWLTRQVAHYSQRITQYTTPPLALVTNGLSLIIFTRMHRAKQQVNRHIV